MGNKTIEPADAARKPTIFDKVASAVDETMQKPFARLGEAVGNSPKTTMAAALFVCVVCMSGLSQIGAVTESRSDKLWIPSSSRSQDDAKRYEENFPRSGSIAYFIAEAKTEGEALSKDALTDLLALHDTIVSLKTKDGSGDDPESEGTVTYDLEVRTRTSFHGLEDWKFDCPSHEDSTLHQSQSVS